MPDEDYMASLEEARELIQLAGQTAEGRAAARRWLRQVIGDVGGGDGEPAVLQPVPPELAGTGYTVNRDAMRRAGYDATTIALSETGDADIELYPDPRGPGGGDPDVMLGGQYDDSGPDADGGTMQYDMAAMHQAAVQDEVDRLSLLMQGRRPGPARPEYAGRVLRERQQLDDEPDADKVVQATMQLAALTEGRATFRECAEAVDEMALSRSPQTAREAGSRADALARLAGMFPGQGPAAAELDLELARQREIDRLTRGQRRGASDRIGRRQGAEPDEAETAEEEVDSIVERHQDMLSHAPRKGRTTLTSDADYDKYSDQPFAGQPSRGGVIHPEVERLAREHGLLVGWSPNERHEVPSARERERAERRARPGHQGGLFTIEQLHKAAMRSATSSRG